MRFRNSLDQWYFERFLLDVAIATVEKGGIAARIETYQLLPSSDTWGFPKYPGKTAILAPDVDLVAELSTFIDQNAVFLSESDCCLGTWINPHTNHYYLDVTTSCPNLDVARQIARAISLKEGRQIVALYNAKRQQTVYLWENVRA